MVFYALCYCFHVYIFCAILLFSIVNVYRYPSDTGIARLPTLRLGPATGRRGSSIGSPLWFLATGREVDEAAGCVWRDVDDDACSSRAGAWFSSAKNDLIGALVRAL